MNPSKPKKYKSILSIDGGGVRGIIAAQILATLEHRLQARTGNPESRLADYFDLIAGTGTGAILACAYLSPVKPHIHSARFNASQVVDLYVKYAATIFNETFDHKIVSLGGLIDEKYSSTEIEKVFNSYFEDLHLKHLLKPCLITAYDITKRNAYFFNRTSAMDKPSADFFVRDVARAATALPTYFECKEIQSFSGVGYTLIDGSIFANNPALCAFTEARKIFSQQEPQLRSLPIEQLLIFSLGTGLPKTQYTYEDAKDWGLAAWSKPIIDIAATANAETVDYHLSQLYENIGKSNQYLRINPELPIDIEADIDNAEPENLTSLKELGITLTEEYEDKIDEFVKLLLATV
ncbi:patatin [Rhodocytophaga rosea]|uniref:Patatin n=1 Tax=Rhodocytophaga rosea TaxID=2704465 RepID=A0A6C0GDA3_9BACT|nr:patatin-like phospholipase family protein [Rhodocytophaga rosea]QHT65941.1 patatin [Rhodocytophaga rosea]